MAIKQGKSEIGEIKIHDQVIIAIARRAAMEVDGVVRISSGFKKGFLSILGKRRFYRGISVQKSDEDEIRVHISVVVRYGVNIPELANNIQSNVKKALEEIAGVVPLEVSIEIDGLESKEGEIKVLENMREEKNEI